MNMDVNEKPASKFPRSSLRACNKTLIVSSSEARRFRAGVGDEAQVAVADLLDPEQVANGAAVSALEEAPVTSEEVQPKGEVSDSRVMQETTSEADPLDDIFDGLEDGMVTTGSSHGMQTANTSKEESGEVVQTMVTEESLSRSTQIELQRAEDDLSLEDVLSQSEGADVDSPQLATESGQSRPIHSGREFVEWRRRSRIVGFLVSFDSDVYGSYIELREGRLLVSTERHVSENCLVIAHSSVSPMHAILRIGGDGTILILDQLSEQGTRIKRGEDGKEESLLGDKSSLGHGDMVIFGECAYHVCILKTI